MVVDFKRSSLLVVDCIYRWWPWDVVTGDSGHHYNIIRGPQPPLVTATGLKHQNITLAHTDVNNCGSIYPNTENDESRSDKIGSSDLLWITMRHASVIKISVFIHFMFPIPLMSGQIMSGWKWPVKYLRVQEHFNLFCPSFEWDKNWQGQHHWSRAFLFYEREFDTNGHQGVV